MSTSRFRSMWVPLASGLLVVLLAFVWIGCETSPDGVVGPISATTDTGVLAKAQENVKAVMAVQDRHTEELMAKRGVVGTATGLTPDGRLAVLVLTSGAENLGDFPLRVDGVPLVIREVGEIVALSHATGRFNRPVPVGVSTGHPDITAGTIGCRVTDGKNVYALSNNHVYADENKASKRDNVLQPGPFDGGVDPDDAIGTLFDFEPIKFDGSNNTIDAAIALSSTADLGNATPSDGYGTPKSTSVAASVGMRVMKYGRTTGLTKGRVDAINATVDVGYSSGVARFVNQIIIRPGGFSSGGDSGSLIVAERGSDKGKPVGLLFAGSFFVTVANPIDPILARFGVTIDDGVAATNNWPSADAGGPYSGTEDAAIFFDGSGSSDPDGDPLTYTWDFGDGNTATTTKATVSHTYLWGGTFDVTLTVSDGKGGTDTASSSANVTEVNDTPVADPNGPYGGTEGEAITFDGSGSSDFDNEDGTTTNNQTLSYRSQFPFHSPQSNWQG